MLRRLFPSFALVLAAAGCGNPELPDFSAGGIAGASCPPGSEAEGSCGGADCGSPCVVQIACNPDVTVCPLGTTCDTLEGDTWCIPTEFCMHGSDCANDGYCSRDADKGICAVVPPKGGMCKTQEDCSWPYTCQVDGACGLLCNEDQAQCPASMACVENRCVTK